MSTAVTVYTVVWKSHTVGNVVPREGRARLLQAGQLQLPGWRPRWLLRSAGKLEDGLRCRWRRIPWHHGAV